MFFEREKFIQARLMLNNYISTTDNKRMVIKESVNSEYQKNNVVGS